MKYSIFYLILAFFLINACSKDKTIITNKENCCNCPTEYLEIDTITMQGNWAIGRLKATNYATQVPFVLSNQVTITNDTIYKFPGSVGFYGMRTLAILFDLKQLDDTKSFKKVSF